MDEKILNGDGNNLDPDNKDTNEIVSDSPLSDEVISEDLNIQESESEQPEAISVDEETLVEEPDSAEVPMVESSTYAFRWDYSTQADYDKSVTAKTKKNRGVLTYVTILAVTFMLSVSLVIASVIIGNSIQKSNLSNCAS